MTLECETLVLGSAAVAVQIAANVRFQFNPAATPPEFYEEEIDVWKCYGCYKNHLDLLRATLASYRETI